MDYIFKYFIYQEGTTIAVSAAANIYMPRCL